ncbi:MAG: RsmB/NOP family class I SAM-dependent RNA methyltransferase [Candidatus Gracilibacteria bacterium]|nr:RsmB/NOP family class I SAM-dependent RNA methyltransferase [Candidatus Gracilibacteria bacterium]
MSKIPQLLQDRLQKILGKDFDAVMSAYSHERMGSFRINFLKGDGADVFVEFAEKGIVTKPFDNVTGAYLFDREHEYVIKGTRAFYDGKIYLQSLASMIPVLALDPRSNETILDVCAAPGSKTTQLASMMHNTGKIVAIEQNQIRFDKLIHNCRLQGATNIEGVKLDAKKYFEGDFEVTGTEIHKKGKYAKYIEPKYSELTDAVERKIPLFDRILIDAPCSAEGRIHLENEKTYGFWSLANIEQKAELQYELLSAAVDALKSGGTIVYSTCTLAPEENEGVVARVLAENKDLRIQDITLGLAGNAWWKLGLTSWKGVEYSEDMKKAIRILPSGETEGFFIVKIGKR